MDNSRIESSPWPALTRRVKSAAWWGQVGRLLWRAVKDLFYDNGPHWSAAISYYTLLSLFPLLLVTAAVAAYFVDPNWAVSHLTNFLGEYVPAGENQIESVIQGVVDSRRALGLISVGVLFWTGSRVFGAIIKAFSIVYDDKDEYSFWQRRLIELIMLLTLGSVALLALTSRWLLDLVWYRLDTAAEWEGLATQVIRLTVPVILLAAAFFLMYRFIPRRPQPWQAALAGTGVATLLFLLARPLFLGYLTWFARYNLFYGSLAVVVMLLFWVWLVALILLFGGQVACHVQKWLADGRLALEADAGL